MARKSILALDVSTVLAASGSRALVESSTTGPFGFGPIDASVNSAAEDGDATRSIPPAR